MQYFFIFAFYVFISVTESEFTTVDLLSTPSIMKTTLQLQMLFLSFSTTDMKKDI
jgi:hypothetical protein